MTKEDFKKKQEVEISILGQVTYIKHKELICDICSKLGKELNLKAQELINRGQEHDITEINKVAKELLDLLVSYYNIRLDK